MTRPLWILLFLALAAPQPGRALELDLRRMLTADEHRAWRGVGRVNIANFSERGMCTGTLISEDIVITAAHCVISDRTGLPHEPGNIHFVAGWRRGSKVGHSKARDVLVHPEYDPVARTSLAQIGRDLALIRLSDPIPAAKAPYFSVAPAPNRRTPLTLISYRRDRAHALTRQEGCDVLGARAGVLALGCDVTFGASGSPLFAEIDGQERLIAVISAMSRDRGRAIAWAVRVDAAIGPLLLSLN